MIRAPTIPEAFDNHCLFVSLQQHLYISTDSHICPSASSSPLKGFPFPFKVVNHPEEGMG
jgi:hypothetical protein